jgi:hypothetical protein
VETVRRAHGSINPWQNIQAMEKNALGKKTYESAFDQAASAIGSRDKLDVFNAVNSHVWDFHGIKIF